MKKIFVLIVISLIIGSCSVHLEKRRYLKGYHLTFNNNKNKVLQPNANSIKNEHTPVTTVSIKSGTELNKLLPTLASQPIELADRNIKNKINSDSKIDLKTKKSNPVKTNNQNSLLQEKTIDLSSQKDSGNNYLLLISGLFIGGFATLFRFFIPHTKAIGYWALNNRKAARGLHFLAHCGVAASGYNIGEQLYDAGITSTGSTLYSLAGFASLVSILYPVRKIKQGFFRNTYFKQKMYAFLMAVTGFMLSVNVGNLNASGQLGKIISNYSIIQADTFENKEIAAEDPLPEKKKRSTGVNVLLTVLTAILSLALCLLLAAGSCSLICSGQTAFAVIILVLFSPAIVLLTVHFIKKIWGMDAKSKREAK